jgi:hypothetical protein
MYYLKGNKFSHINSAVIRQSIIGEIKVDNLREFLEERHKRSVR